MEIRLLTLFTDPVVPRNHPSLSYSDSGTEPKIRQDLSKVRVFQESNPHRTFVNAQETKVGERRRKGAALSPSVLHAGAAEIDWGWDSYW
ncbi:uncharacterized protein FOMMEDRAFT_160548 [Fomitiporia mediterranea MF3/22]|uniref:uncharacterized protein n=1 Tax=Fomitiporia mediterranea (strain MF3/22) TaxID=694068 RepID=UPI0004407A88|nr:uncharacterized protein FOMMEDRAFT_160548 [Fomitiporia mediterranea MF3/22]EJC99490.1 hypothetical protein FOMMEDRAFT_160548 [Fomitiporia mediterranea MF3/22]